VVCDSEVERCVEDQDEGATFAAGGFMQHGGLAGMMGISAGTEELAVNRHVAVEDDDRVCRGMAVRASSRTGSIPNDVVLGAGALVVVEELQLERPIVRGLLGRA
jgi:hypothetical protein